MLRRGADERGACGWHAAPPGRADRCCFAASPTRTRRRHRCGRRAVRCTAAADLGWDGRSRHAHTVVPQQPAAEAGRVRHALSIARRHLAPAVPLSFPRRRQSAAVPALHGLLAPFSKTKSVHPIKPCI